MAEAVATEVDLELLGEAERLARFAIEERDYNAEMEERPGLVRVEIRMIGDTSFVVRGDEGEVREAFRDCPDDYCEIEDVEVDARSCDDEMKPVYEVKDGKITLVSEDEEGDGKGTGGGTCPTTAEILYADLVERVEESMPLGRTAAATRAVLGIESEIEEGVYGA